MSSKRAELSGLRVVFIGGGNMGAALIGGLLGRGFAAGEIAAVDVVAEQRERLAQRFGIVVADGPVPALAGAECYVFAVKPQQLREVAQPWRALVGDRLVITIAAGIRSNDLGRWLGGHSRIVRNMPNTPALINQGITGLFAAAGASAADRETAAAILGAVGECFWVPVEAQLDAVTAVSGSGPAYVFYFIEALEAAAVELGLDPNTARRLALSTFAGAAALAKQSVDPPARLRQNVTSKGGTTERALLRMGEAGLDRLFAAAVVAAEQRACELGDLFGQDQLT